MSILPANIHFSFILAFSVLFHTFRFDKNKFFIFNLPLLALLPFVLFIFLAIQAVILFFITLKIFGRFLSQI